MMSQCLFNLYFGVMKYAICFTSIFFLISDYGDVHIENFFKTNVFSTTLRKFQWIKLKNLRVVSNDII